jgi:GNAT superfamily N-acetyltransferase
MEQENLDFAIRNGCPGDVSFIFSTWLKSFFYGGQTQPPERIYYSHHHALLESILQHPSTYLKVACDKQDPDLIFGWIVWSVPNIVQFIYVKPSWRKLGIGTALLAETGITPRSAIQFTHYTKSGHAWGNSMGASFNPYRILP